MANFGCFTQVIPADVGFRDMRYKIFPLSTGHRGVGCLALDSNQIAPYQLDVCVCVGG